MAHGATELLQAHVFAGHGFDDIRAGDEHVARLVNHEDEVGHRWAVDRTASAWSENHRDLWDDARGLDVATEDPSIGVE